MRPKYTTEQRFWQKVRIAGPDDCWEWQAATQRTSNTQIQGKFGAYNRVFLAHRFSYILAYGPIPKSKVVCHSCDNSLCVNPNHLWLGSQRENMMDRVNKGRLAGTVPPAPPRRAPFRQPPAEERFWLQVDKRGPDECWEWQGAKSKGYGRLWRNGKLIQATRLSYEMHKGPIADGLFVCHACDNKACVNPAHLWLGTNSDNILDAVAKGLHHSPPPPKAHGEQHSQARLTAKQVIEIRQRYAGGGVTQQSLANEYGVCREHIRDIIAHKKWRHLAP